MFKNKRLGGHGSPSVNFMTDFSIQQAGSDPPPAAYFDISGLKEGQEPGSEVRESTHPFAINIRNPLEDTSGSESADENAAYIRSTTLRISVNGGTAECYGLPIEISEKNFSIPFTEDGMTKIYAELTMHKQNRTFSRVGNCSIEIVKSNEPDRFGVGHVLNETAFEQKIYQMIGTVMVSKMQGSIDLPNVFRVDVVQLIGGNFTFGQDIGTDEDENGISTRPGSKEFIATIDDKLYTVTLDVESMKAVLTGGSSS